MAPKRRFKTKTPKGNEPNPSAKDSTQSAGNTPGSPTCGQAAIAKNDSKDTLDIKSDDSIDEFSPLVKSPDVGGASSSPATKSRSKKDSGRSAKNFYNRTPQDGASSGENIQSSATLPIQTRVDWVRLASFDHFDDDSTKYPETYDSQSTSTLSPDSEGSHAPQETRKFIPMDIGDLTAIPYEESPPPVYIANDKGNPKASQCMEQKDDVFVSQLEPPSPHHGPGGESIAHQRLLLAARTVHASVRITRLERARRRAKWAGKKFLVFLVSHIGLTLAVLLYAMAGGFLFRWLEVEKEIERRNNMMEVRQKYLDQMWTETLKLNILHQANWTVTFRNILMKFERRVYKSISEGTWDGAGEDVVSKWTIPGSLLFSTTVITSIGYGDITPRTVAGKLVCIPFAIIGIPLTLLCLANIGQLLAVAFKFFWRRMLECRNLCRYCHLKGKKKTKQADESNKETRIPILVCVAIIVAYTLGGAAIFSSWETGWTFLDGFYFSFITLSTIGFGDFVPGQYEKGTNERRVVCTLYLLTGLALLSMVFQLMIDTVRDITRRYAEIFGLTEEQIARDVKGLDNPVQVQEVVTPVPEQVIVVTPDFDKDGVKDNAEIATHNFDVVVKESEASVKNDNDLTETYDREEEGSDDIQLSTPREQESSTGKDQLVPPSIYISVSEDEEPGDKVDGRFPNDSKLESDPAEIQLGAVGEIEYSDFVATRSDPTLPGSGSMKTLSSLNEVENRQEKSQVGADDEEQTNLEDSSKSLIEESKQLQHR